MKRKTKTIILVLILLAGLSLILYPTLSEYWNASRQTKAISSYARNVTVLSADAKTSFWQAAVEYNQKLTERTNPYVLPRELKEKYRNMLDATGQGIIAYVDIPSLGVLLPIYHGTADAILQTAIGHLDWTSLPVGGEGSHCAVSGHRGLPSAKLFTDLGKLIEGDRFMLQVLDETLTYEVDQILIVEPEDVLPLTAVPGMDLCTLVTCTPYGINTQRMLVRGHRISNEEDAETMLYVSEAIRIRPLLVASFMGSAMLVMLLIGITVNDMIDSARRKKLRAKADNASRS